MRNGVTRASRTRRPAQKSTSSVSSWKCYASSSRINRPKCWPLRSKVGSSNLTQIIKPRQRTTAIWTRCWSLWRPKRIKIWRPQLPTPVHRPASRQWRIPCPRLSLPRRWHKLRHRLRPRRNINSAHSPHIASLFPLFRQANDLRWI